MTLPQPTSRNQQTTGDYINKGWRWLASNVGKARGPIGEALRVTPAAPLGDLMVNQAQMSGAAANLAGIPAALGNSSGPVPPEYLARSLAYNPTAPNPSVPTPIPTTQDEYRGMLERLTGRAQNRAALYKTLMPQLTANLPQSYKEAYSASIPDVGTNLEAYNDALAGSAIVAPQLEELFALLAAQQQQQSSGNFLGLQDPALQSAVPKK